MGNWERTFISFDRAGVVLENRMAEIAIKAIGKLFFIFSLLFNIELNHYLLLRFLESRLLDHPLSGSLLSSHSDSWLLYSGFYLGYPFMKFYFFLRLEGPWEYDLREWSLTEIAGSG